MRGHLGVLAGLAFVLASACGNPVSEKTTTGTTGGGSTTGGASGGTSSGGTTGGLGAGAACAGNAQCASGICGISGSGQCCTAACATSDATCGATGCDATGACLYPSNATACATDVCNGHTLTQSACNGAGGCVAGTPAPCAGNLQCSDATHCSAQCSTSAACVTGFYCDPTNGSCRAKQAHGACTTDEACTSGICGIAGSGACCTARCPSAPDPRCDPTGCDATSGACLGPAACGTPSCTGNTLTAGTCTSTGTCHFTPVSCPNNLVCNSAGDSCLAACAQTADCLGGYYCAATGCLPQAGAGFFCNANEACTSGICGAAGFGHCCLYACDTSDPTCGAKDCDRYGYCSFPINTTDCGPAASCTGTTETSQAGCNGAGSCSPPATIDCTPYVCGAIACFSSCTDSTSCATGFTCDSTGHCS